MAIETYQLSIFGFQGVQPIMNTLHFNGTGLTANDTYSSGTSLVNVWNSSFVSLWLDCCSDDYQLYKVTGRRVSAKPSVVIEELYQAGTFTGSIGDPASGTNLCPSVFLVPVMGTKSGGRCFMPPCPQGQVSNNLVVGSYITAIDALFNVMKAGVTVSGKTWQLVVWSRKHSTASVVTAFQISPAIGFQKRRRVAW